MSSTVIGIDPGLKGGVAIVRERSADFHRMPVHATHGKKEVDPFTLHGLLKREDVAMVVIERVGANRVGGRRQGGSSMFTFGMGYGLVIGALAALRLPLVLVPPLTWKRAMGVTSDKQTSLAKARQLYPQFAEQFTSVKDDGLAEAALLAAYGVRLRAQQKGTT